LGLIGHLHGETKESHGKPLSGGVSNRARPKHKARAIITFIIIECCRVVSNPLLVQILA
jgi:hypothetical protein